jgi:dynein heavy chain, axonemal
LSLFVDPFSQVEHYLSCADSLHNSFRLWLTAEPHPTFPIGLLQAGIKVTNEPPVGLRAGLRASYQWITQDMLDAVPGPIIAPHWRRLLFVCCYLHSVVQERRRFGPIGWNIPYEFSAGDLAACVRFLQNHLLETEALKRPEPDWATVRYMIASIQYGGRITDDRDRLLMDTYAESFFHSGALDPGHELFTDPGTRAVYKVPEGVELEMYRAAVEALPATEGPELFGLHPNADLAFRTLQAREALRLVADTRPRGAAGVAGAGSNEGVDRTCAELLEKMPPLLEGERFSEYCYYF